MTKKSIQKMEQEFIKNDFPLLAFMLHESIRKGDIFKAAILFDTFMKEYVKRLYQKNSNDSLVQAVGFNASVHVMKFLEKRFDEKQVDEFANSLLEVAKFSDEEVAELMVD